MRKSGSPENDARSPKVIKVRWLNASLLLPFIGAVALTPAAERKPALDPVVSLEVVPPQVTLWGSQASQHFLVLAHFADGVERDVTSQARLSLSPADKGRVDTVGKFMASASGEVLLAAKFGGRSSSAVIQIKNVNEPRPFTFAREIDGILTRRGCNDTSCHAGVKGRAGFKLSMYALSPRGDYQAIVEGDTYRVLTIDAEPKRPRINLKEPEKSLLLLKPTFSVPHGGGLRFNVGSPDYQKLLNWIRSGAPFGEEAEKQGATVERVEVFPREVALDAGGRQQLLVTAYLSSGRREDATERVRYVSNNPSVADVSETGVVQAKSGGETDVLIRIAGRTLNSVVGVIDKRMPDYPRVEARNYVDQFVFAKLRKFQILPSALSSDSEFLRRVCLDLTGTLPPPRRVREFLANKDPHKREKLIEILLNSPEYVDYWGFQFSDLLRVTGSGPYTPEGTKAYENWVINSIAANKPYDQIARERIAAQGYSAPARNLYYVGELSTPEVLMPELIRLFMGRRIECAQCHNHPFEPWTQNQFWGLAAYFGGYTEVRKGKMIIDVLGGGHVDNPRDMLVTNPRTKEKVAPAFLDGTPLPESQWMDPRMRLAEQITSHPYFAEAAVNRIWSCFFSRGIVDPVDDFRSANPPTDPELLEALANDFREHGYDLKHLMRVIAESRAYQLSGIPSENNKDDKINYSHAAPRPLEAAVLLDAITSATGVPERFVFPAASIPHSDGSGAPPPGARAMQMIPDFCPSQFMQAYGRSTRKGLPVGPAQPNLTQALDMLAGPTYTEKISQSGGRLDRLLKQGASDEQIIEEFYLAGFARLPTQAERTKLLGFLSQRASRREESLAAVVWAILGSREFAFNH
jgi:hypothetical protein